MVESWIENQEKNDLEFQKFKYAFLYCFIFKQIERPDFDKFLKIHFKVYEIIYKNIYTVEEYAKISINKDISEFDYYGIILK